MGQHDERHCAHKDLIQYSEHPLDNQFQLL